MVGIEILGRSFHKALDAMFDIERCKEDLKYKKMSSNDYVDQVVLVRPQ